MAHTKYEGQKVDHTSWLQWMNENIDRVKEFYEKAIANLKIIARQAILKLSGELRFFISKLTVVDFFCGSIALGIMAFASLFLISGLGLVSYQIFLWIKNGVWSEFSIMVVFDFLFENSLVAEWLSDPESWFGLQKIVEWLLQNIPLSVALIIPSIMALSGIACMSIAALIFRFYQFKTRENI